MNTYKRKNTVRRYDLLRNVPVNVSKEYARYILSVAGEKTILDFGFGTGNTLIPLIKSKGQNIIYGIDNSKQMRKKFREKAQIEKLKVPKIYGEVNKFIKSHGQVDVLHFKAVLHCSDNPKKLLKKLVQCVKPGGFIITGHEISQTEDRIEQLFKYSGVIDKEVEKIFKLYFYLRKNSVIRKPFIPRKFPAGDSNKTVEYLTVQEGITFFNSKYTSIWGRKVTIQDILATIKEGTFGVFSDGLTKAHKKYLHDFIWQIAKSDGIDIFKIKKLPCRLKVNILKKSL